MIAICIPTYNYAHYLPYAIRSCLSQDEDFELIVADDNSTDHTESLKEQFVGDPRVRWCSNNGARLPIQQNWNRVINLASRPYVKILPADDALKPGSISTFYAMIKKHPEICLHGHLAEVIDAEGKIVRKHAPFDSAREVLFVSGSQALKGKLRQQIRFREPVCNFFKKSAWEAVGGYQESCRFVFDVYLNIKLLHRFPSALWNKYLAQVRRHASSDGSVLAAELALDNLQFLVNEINTILGDDLTFLDREAGRGWLTYRMLELGGQRFKRKPMQSIALLLKHFGWIMDPVAGYYSYRLIRNRLLTGDVQQRIS